MIATISLLAVFFIQLIISRIAAIALIHTGLSSKAAKFQARSALSGCGFTTRESEQIMAHPVRRWVIQNLMLVGNLGIIAAVSTSIISFVEVGSDEGIPPWLFTTIFVLGIILLIYLANSRYFEKLITFFFNLLIKRYDIFKFYDLNSICDLAHGYKVVETLVHPHSNWVGKPVKELLWDHYKIRVLGIQSKSDQFVGTFNPSLMIQEDDLITLYGLDEHLQIFIRTQKN